MIMLNLDFLIYSILTQSNIVQNLSPKFVHTYNKINIIFIHHLLGNKNSFNRGL